MSRKDLDEELRNFKIKMLPEYSRETLERAARRIRTLERRGMDPFKVNETWIYEYCAEQLEASKKRNSLRIEMEDLSRWTRYTGQEIKLPHFTKEAQQDPWVPTFEQYREVLRTCNLKFREQIRDYLKQPEHEKKWFRTALAIRVLAEGGMRVSELLRMNIDEKREKGYYIRSSKKEKDRFVALAPATLEMIERWIREFRPKTDPKALWTGDYGRIKPAVVRSFIKEAGKAAGVSELHPHSLRHYCGTMLMERGMDIRKIQVHLGHSSIQSTQLYTHIRSQTLQAEIYELYSSVREPDFFEYEEGVVI